MIRLLWRLHVLFCIMLCTWPASAQQAGAAETAVAAQASVARLSHLEGEARVTPTDKTVEPVEAALNMPLWPGNVLQTGRNGAAEIEFPDGSVLRVTENSAATLLRLQPETQSGLDDGLYYLELRAGSEPGFTVFAGEVSITPVENASFRIRVLNNQPEIAVLRGSVSVTRANSYTVDLTAGESLRTDPKNNRRYLLSDSVSSETWDHWNEARAQALLDATAARTIAREDFAGEHGYGWSDLDSSGTWYAMPGEGFVWQPYSIDASWDPYGYGNWVYGNAGYVWASGYNWGWLPYRCGQWTFFNGFGWAWQPAAGCRTFGGGAGASGWSGGRFPVNRAPRGWRPPQPPPANPPHSIAGGTGVRVPRPTLPVRPIDGPPPVRSGQRIATRTAQPLRVGEVVLQPLTPLHVAETPHGASAVGSALYHDFPVESVTRRPSFGLEATGRPVVPGRVADWRSVGPRTEETASHAASNAGEPAHSVPVVPVGGVPVGGAVVQNLPAWRRGPVSNLPRTTTSATDPPVGAQGAPPSGAQGVPPVRAQGPPPINATGAPPHTGRFPAGSAPVQTLGGAGATPYAGPSPSVFAPRPSLPVQRAPENLAPIRPAPAAPAAPAVPRAPVSMPPPSPAPVRSAPAPSQPVARPSAK